MIVGATSTGGGVPPRTKAFHCCLLLDCFGTVDENFGVARHLNVLCVISVYSITGDDCIV